MSGCALLAEMTENLFIHMRAIRKITIHQDDRAARSIADHMRIIEAIERRDPELAARLAREHTLGLAAHVEQHGDFLTPAQRGVTPSQDEVHLSGDRAPEGWIPASAGTTNGGSE
jgi:DNA-binding GntR family transcriptional regulator